MKMPSRKNQLNLTLSDEGYTNDSYNSEVPPAKNNSDTPENPGRWKKIAELIPASNLQLLEIKELEKLTKAINISGKVEKAARELMRNIRESIMEECQWSPPTYYRKQRNGGRCVSNAERQAIRNIVEKNVNTFLEQITKLVNPYRKDT
ncbi:hypothetical protein ACDQ55_15195 [Chitinophaga sp. 30R24]|uniref:hypothetical protein n=1 Tax=Chitinophaga sp. 30R24 TaxID=3248838 RepID=UPI003B9111D9